jgi:ATP-dependent Clp protease ATP-binding subunit ClpA
MFEKYTEKARRVIFFARYEASQFGQPYIETEHLLLGLLREDKALTSRFLRSNHASVEYIRRQVESHTTIRESISTSVDLPLRTSPSGCCSMPARRRRNWATNTWVPSTYSWAFCAKKIASLHRYCTIVVYDFLQLARR